MEIILILIKKFHKCSRILISRGSFPSCTASGASRCRSGKKRVPMLLVSSKWAHQAHHGPGYPVVGPRDHGHQCHHCLHHLPSEARRNFGNKAALPRHDHQERTSPLMQLKKYFTFEVQVLDDKNVRRRFRASNYQSTTRVKPFICTMPMRLDEGWNQIQFNLSDFTRRAYGSNYI